MIYDDEKLYKELLTLLKTCKENISNFCPVCENDPRPQHDCKFCEVDHMGSDCFRDGKHKDDCLLIKHSALVEIDIETKGVKG